MAGTSISADEKTRVRDELATFTGLSPSYLDAVQLRVKSEPFMEEYGKQVGFHLSRFDGRNVGSNEAGEIAKIQNAPPFAATDSGRQILEYLNNNLNIKVDKTYVDFVILGLDWNWPEGSRFTPFHNLDLVGLLASAMDGAKDLRVMLAGGYFDLATPLYEAELTLASPDLPLERVTVHRYLSGHRVPSDPKLQEMLSHDIRSFIRQGWGT